MYNISSDLFFRGDSLDSPQAITKILRPGKRNALLQRPRLINFLHENIERKLLLVSAAAGYGKTSLLIDFAHETALPVCWYSLDASDADPKVFLESIVASLRRAFPDFGMRTRDLLAVSSAAPRDLDVIVGALVTEMVESIPRYFILVLDDYHTIEESAPINQVVDALLRLLPENAHLIIASRTLPARLTLTRLAARQEIAGLGVNDLRFTSDEIRAFIRQNYRIELTDLQALELAEQSEGWITGLLLTTHSLWQGLFQDLRKRGQPGNVFNYLMHEVFVQQPAALQDFLLKTAILDQLNPALCDDLLGARDSAELLRDVEQRNLFIVRLEEEETWYRYHHLFREFLQTRLRETDGTRWRELHRHAAAMFQTRGALDQSIAHFLQAEFFDDAARALERIATETFDAGHWATLAKWIDALPAKVLDEHPDLIVARGMIFANTGEMAQAQEFFARALIIYEKQSARIGMGRALIKQANCQRLQGRYQEAVENCKRGLLFLNADAQRESAEGHRTIGTALGLLGDWNTCIEELELAAELYAVTDDLTSSARVHHDLGVAYRTIASPAARKHFQSALEYWQRTGNSAGLANTLNSVGVGYHREGNYAQAIDTLEQARVEARQSGQLRIEATALASLGDVRRDQAEYVRAQEAYQKAFEIARQINEGSLITYTLDALGETYCLNGDLATADRLIQQALGQAENHHSNYELGLTVTSLGILRNVQGDPRAATEQLTRAVELLERGGAKRDSARAHLHLANAYFLQRKYREVSVHLKVTAELGALLHEDQFIAAEGSSLAPLIQYAASKKIGAGYFGRVLDKIAASPPASADQSPSLVRQPSRPHVAACAFGIAQADLNGTPVTTADWDSTATKELFFLLLAHPPGLRKEQILNAQWSDLTPAKANGIFHSTVWRLRRALSPECVVYENGVYRIGTEIEVGYDVAAFEQALNRVARTQNEEERAAHLRDALVLYRGDYFEDCYSAWCLPIRNVFLLKYLDTLLALALIYDHQHKIPEASVMYQRLLDRDSYREDVYRALMRLQARSGDRTGAMATYQRCAQVLQSELHLDPAPETRALFERILTDAPLDD